MGTKKIVALRPARHTRLSRLNSASDVADRDHVVAHPDRASMATTMAGQRVIIGGRLRTFARALRLRWRRSQEPRRRLIDGGWRCVTHGRQQFSGFLEAEDGGFDVRVRIMTLSHQPGLRGRRHEPQESAGEVFHAHRHHVAMRQQGFIEGSPARGELSTMRQEVLQAEDAGGHSSWTDFSPLQAAARAGPRLQPHTIRGFQGGAWSNVDGDGQRGCPEGFNARSRDALV